MPSSSIASIAGAHYGQGRILREQKKDVPGALAAMEKAVALDAADAGILTELGAVLYESKQIDRTIQTLEKARGHAPTTPTRWDWRCSAWR